ncbi:hypothetical protein [Kribbella kalugense]|uniref:Uncharacterized protein n=1 Tax=Kribbella kalugense TaxID=2512221 RepID=A0A4R7ZYX6_9ACTN|nr:hypothetical protein [Kribbella kalugense]TDW23349.1 hypothetical protein EV650_2202 [Kribbella kalugense]
MDKVLKALGAYSAVVGIVALVTGKDSWSGKFSEILWLLLSMYIALVPTGLIVAGISNLPKTLLDVDKWNDAQTIFAVGAVNLSLAFLIRYGVLDSGTRTPSTGAAVAGAVLLAIPFILITFRSLAAPAQA